MSAAALAHYNEVAQQALLEIIADLVAANKQRDELAEALRKAKAVMEFEHSIRPEYGWLKWVNEHIDPVLAKL